MSAVLGFISLALNGVLKLLATIFTWLVKNPAIMMTGIIGIMFLMVVISKNDHIDALRQENKNKDAQIILTERALGQARTNVATLNGQLGVQNDSIKALAQQGIDAGKKFDILMAAESVSNATLARKLTTLDSAKPGPDKCVSAQALVKGMVK